MVNIKANFCKFADNSKLCLAFIRVPRGYRNFASKEIAQTHFFLVQIKFDTCLKQRKV